MSKPLFVLVADPIFESDSQGLSKIKDAINEVLTDHDVDLIKLSELKEEQLPHIHFGCFLVRDQERWEARELLDKGTPLILIGSEEEAEKFRDLINPRFEGEFEKLSYSMGDDQAIKGAVHWVVNYYHSIKEKAVKVEVEEQEKVIIEFIKRKFPR